MTLRSTPCLSSPIADRVVFDPGWAKPDRPHGRSGLCPSPHSSALHQLPRGTCKLGGRGTGGCSHGMDWVQLLAAAKTIHHPVSRPAWKVGFPDWRGELCGPTRRSSHRQNTDGQGFLASLRTVSDPLAKRVTILGAGGAARAIAVELALAGAAEITIVNRDVARAEGFTKTLHGSTSTSAHPVHWSGTYEIPPEIDILVNATSVGLAPRVEERLDVNMDTIGSRLMVCDVIMNPPQTNLLRTVASHGATVLDGRGMLVNQAALNIWNWTGVQVDTDVLRSALDEVL